MITADWQNSAMRNRAFLDNNHPSRARANIGQTNAHFTFIGTQHRISTSKRLENRVVYVDPGTVHGRDHVLSSRGGSRDHVHPDFEPRRNHAERIMYARMFIENEFLWKQMEHFTVRR